MSDNKRPPGYVPLTIHELAASNKGKKGTGLDYVYSLDARAIDESVLGSSAARAVTGSRSMGGGRPNGSQGGDQYGSAGGRGGRNRNRNRNRNRRGGRGDGPNFGGDGMDGGEEWTDEGGSQHAGGNGSAVMERQAASQQETAYEEE